MTRGEVIVRFEGVSYDFGIKKPILEEVDFSIRKGSKITLMGQNGAGKSTIFGLVTGTGEPTEGIIHIQSGLSIAISRQVIPRDQLDLTVREFFQKVFPKVVYDIDPKIDAVLEVVNLVAPHDKIIRAFSGGQQARLLLASALIQNPDLLLLDEPTNNLDHDGIEHLTKFLIDYKKTVIVISHDAEFLNSFTQGVLYLDVRTRKVEQYVGNYDDVLQEISVRIEKENRKNALLAKEIQENKDKANFFANKGGQMRMVAKRMREKAEELEESKVDVRKEDKAIRSFRIPFQENLVGEILTISSLLVIKNHKPVERKMKASLRRNFHLLLAGPNGIGKSTLLQSLADGTAKGATLLPGVRLGYYRQDFSNLDFDKTVYQELSAVLSRPIEEEVRRVAAGFLISGEIFHSKIGTLSEGQKGLVAFARLVLLKPGLLILDEPTNHINFRHLPIIAEALSAYEGPMIVVSHVPDFIEKIRIDEVLDLSK
ncbi:MAG: transporter family protein ATP-binding cassette, subfamily er 3 [Candidatus Adlerbacteria bacterium]|nr:transporter family protein ATP-binding cassette, subfamily er 3 [Candidatus Adlerbacteria bacterium]